MSPEDAEHARRIPGDLELWKIGVGGRRLGGDRRSGELSVSQDRLAL
jgi:hypothetical protein